MLDWLLAYNQGIGEVQDTDEFRELKAQIENQEDGEEDDDNDGVEAEY